MAISNNLFAKTFLVPPPVPDRWVCTAAMCRRAAIPWSLYEASRFLQLPQQKMEGKGLIQMFCCPVEKYPRGFEKEQGWRDFRAYCMRDVEAERIVYKRLCKSFGVEKEPGFAFDARMNSQGIPVNREALTNALTLVELCETKVNAEFAEITGGLKPSQRDKVLEWLRTRGYPALDLKANTMEAVLEDPPETMDTTALRALELRAGSAFAAVKKIPVMLAASEHGGNRVRGGFLWSGALRTHRWSGRIVQPQNFKRPTIKDTELAYSMIKRGCDAEDFDLLWDTGVVEVIASCVRHFIELPGKTILDADYSNIEARITPWLCHQTAMLDEFRRGEDPYIAMAQTIFNTTKVSKDQRFVGKVACLSCQFQVGWVKFQKMCAAYGRQLPDETCQLAVEKYRAKRDKLVQMWTEINNAAKRAIRKTGTIQHAGRIQFVFGKLATADFHALQMKLPSGHKLTYPLAKIVNTSKQFGKNVAEVEEIQFWGPHPTRSQWGWQSTYGGKLLENATQAVGGDFMTHGLLEAETRGYHCFATIHDQALCVKEDGLTAEGLREALCVLPAWAEDFPLDATANETACYTKD